MKVRVCEDERTRWTGEERSAAWSGWDAVRGGRGGFMARGKAGLTGQRQRRLVLPGFLLKTRPPFPPAHLAPVSSPSPPPPLYPSLSSLLLLSLPSFTLQFFPLALFFSLHSFHFSHFLSFFSFSPSSSGPLQTLNSGLRGGGGWLRWWDG